MTPDYETGTVVSSDGTAIGYRTLGSGPALVLLHGGMQASQNLMTLARLLADRYRVVLPDRRGRGLSGPQGEDFRPGQWTEDALAVVEATGATRLFGLSAGALIALRTALVAPTLEKVARYEPPLSIDGSVSLDWLPRFRRELDAGDIASALVTNLRGLGTERLMGAIPRFLLVPALRIGSRFQTTAPGDVPILDLVPTQRFDLQLVEDLADTVDDYRAVGADVLLLRGTRSPSYFAVAEDELARVLPRSRTVVLDGLGHSGPDEDGDPRRVSGALGAFFAD